MKSVFVMVAMLSSLAAPTLAQVRAVARQGAATGIASIPGSTWVDIGCDGSSACTNPFAGPAAVMSPSGRCLFRAGFNLPGSISGSGVFFGRPGSLELIARDGDAAPGTSGFFVNFLTTVVAGVYEDAAFIGATSEQSLDLGLFYYSALGGVQPVVFRGTVLDDVPGVPDGTIVTSIGTYSMSLGGGPDGTVTLAFFARTHKPGFIPEKTHLFAWNNVSGISVIATEGDVAPVPTSNFVFLPMFPDPGTWATVYVDRAGNINLSASLRVTGAFSSCHPVDQARRMLFQRQPGGALSLFAGVGYSVPDIVTCIGTIPPLRMGIDDVGGGFGSRDVLTPVGADQTVPYWFVSLDPNGPLCDYYGQAIALGIEGGLVDSTVTPCTDFELGLPLMGRSCSDFIVVYRHFYTTPPIDVFHSVFLSDGGPIALYFAAQGVADAAVGGRRVFLETVLDDGIGCGTSIVVAREGQLTAVVATSGAQVTLDGDSVRLVQVHLPTYGATSAGSSNLIPHVASDQGHVVFFALESTSNERCAPTTGVGLYIWGCLADFNADGSIDPDDLGDYFNCFASHCCRADVNNDGLIDPDDLGDFVNAYYGGCDIP